MAELRAMQFREHFQMNARLINQLFVGITEKEKMSRATFEGSGSGLFALLPPPMHCSKKKANRPLTKKQTTHKPSPTSTTSDPNRLPSQKHQSALNALMVYESDSDEEEGGGGVVSNSSVQHVVESGDKTASHGRPPQQFQRISGKRKREGQEDVLIDANVADYLDPSQLIKGISEESAYQPHCKKDNLPSSQQRRKKINYLAFQFQRISGKRKRGSQDIQITDVKVYKYNYLDLPDSLKRFYESAYQPHRKKDNLPTSQQRKKNQITYLAFKAKERELELKNQWSHWN